MIGGGHRMYPAAAAARECNGMPLMLTLAACFDAWTPLCAGTSWWRVERSCSALGMSCWATR